MTALLWDFFFTEPRYSFRIVNAADALMFATYFVIALAMGHLAARLRAQQEAERRREQRATAMYLLTRELAQASDFADLLAIIIREVGKAANADVANSPAHRALPALKPNQPTHRSPVPIRLSTTLCGGMGSRGCPNRLPSTSAQTRPAMPALICTTVPPAKSSTPLVAQNPLVDSHIMCAIGE